MPFKPSTIISNNFPHMPEDIKIPAYEGKTTYKDQSRFYLTPSGNKLPSVSTVMGYDPDKTKTLQAWRDRVGKDKAAAITAQSSSYGTMMHDCLDHYLNNDMDALTEKIESKSAGERLIPMGMFDVIKKFCDKNVQAVYHQELPIYSERLGMAGRFDCLCKMNGVPVIMDFKNSRRPKRKEWVKGYQLQSTAYAEMISEHSGVNIEWFVIPIVSFDGTLQVFTGKVADYRQQMIDQVCKYYDEVMLKDF